MSDAPATVSEAPEVFTTEPAKTFVEEGHGVEVPHAEPELLGLVPFQWVSLAMAVLFLIALFYAKVHKAVARGLDGKIAEIRGQLEEARNLRAEAEALRDEYAARIANAEKDAAGMLEHARAEADGILEKAEADSKALVERRKKMAEDKIAAAEREAIDDVRTSAAKAAATAARGLIAERHDAAADRKLADQIITGI